jgi:hypothetical protein
LRLGALEAHTLERDQLLDFKFRRMEHQLAVYLGPHPSWEDLRALTFSFVNIVTQLASGEPLSSDVLTQGTSMAFPYGLRNVAQVIECHVARLSSPTLTSNEFVGMAEFFVETIHDRPASDLESISGSASSKGSHHPSRECFMAETSEGHVASASDSGETPHEVPKRAGAGGMRVPPPTAVASAPPQLG